MTLFGLALRNIREFPVRNLLTVLLLAVSILTFVLLRTVVWAWGASADAAAPDRIVTRHKVTFAMAIPRKYFDDVRTFEGIEASTFTVWTEGRSPAHDREFFPALAVHAPTYFEVFDEIHVEEEVRKTWFEDRKGAVVGGALAAKLGWKAGDRVRLTSGIYPDPGEWEFVISGTYRATRKSVDETWFLFHYDYLNDSIPDLQKDQIGWISSRVSNPSRIAAIGKQLDDAFDVRDVQTLTMSEGEAQRSFVGMASAVLRAIDGVCIVILAIMILIVANTIAMAVRDRSNRYAVMQAIGFRPEHILLTVMCEGLLMGALGGGLGLCLAFPFINLIVARFLAETMGSWFPYFYVTPELAALALGLALIVGVVASILPARGAARSSLVDAFRRVT